MCTIGLAMIRDDDDDDDDVAMDAVRPAAAATASRAAGACLKRSAERNIGYE